MHVAKPTHPMDMAQHSKAPINFASSPDEYVGPAHNTPTKPASTAANGVRSTGLASARSSPCYQNGDSIDLPEIPTDSECEGFENEVAIPDWANSPALLIQETMDPVSVFGLPGEIKLAEMFKSAEGPGALTAGLVRLHQQPIVLCG